MAVVVVTKVGGGSENGGSDRSQDGGRGCGAGARRLPGAVVWPPPPLRLGRGNENYRSRRAGRGGGGAVLCVRLEEPEAEERGLLLTLSFLAVTCLGSRLRGPERSAAVAPSFVCGLRPRSI